jgi:peptidoglycan/LPS O-acetylase OafA/YrhL
MIRLNQLARIAGTLIALVGLVHFVVGLQEYVWPSYDALWFHGTGMGLLLAGALTMLAGSKRAWRTVGLVALLANLLGLGLATAFSTLSEWNAPQGPLLIALFVGGAFGCIPAVRQV